MLKVTFLFLAPLSFDVYIYTHIYTYTHISIYLYILNNDWSNLASTLLKANEKELFKTYPKLTKKYPDSQLEYTGGSAKITQTLNCYYLQDAVYLLKN